MGKIYAWVNDEPEECSKSDTNNMKTTVVGTISLKGCRYFRCP
jgi:hypothetical protein